MHTLQEIPVKSPNYIQGFKLLIPYSDVNYFKYKNDKSTVKAGFYEFQVFRFEEGFSFCWTFNKNNKKMVASGNCLHVRNCFKDITELKEWLLKTSTLGYLSNLQTLIEY